MATIGYLDLGAVQRKSGGSGTANTGYLDVGAVQRQETTGRRFLLTPFLWPILLVLFRYELSRCG